VVWSGPREQHDYKIEATFNVSRITTIGGNDGSSAASATVVGSGLGVLRFGFLYRLGLGGKVSKYKQHK